MGDLISRQAAIDAVIKRDANCGIDSAEVLKLLPSTETDKEPTEEEVVAFCERRYLKIISKEFYLHLTQGKYLPPPVVTPDIIYCRDCKNHIDKRCIEADHHTSDNECCMTVFHAERRTDG